MKRPTQPVWYSLAVLLTCVLLLAGSGIWYTNRVQREADHRWCELLTVLTAGPAPPRGPADDRARVIVDLLTRLRADLGC